MHIPSLKRRREQGSTLLTVVIIGGIICAGASSMLVLSGNSVSNAYGRMDWDKAFYITENAVVWAAQSTFDTSPSPGSSNYFSTAGGNLPLGELVSTTGRDTTFMGAW